MPNSEKTTLLQFPCDFVIKVMGKATKQFEEHVLNIILKHFPNSDLQKVTKRRSQDNNFIALSINIHPETQDQLDTLYKDLTNTKEVLFAL